MKAFLFSASPICNGKQAHNFVSFLRTIISDLTVFSFLATYCALMLF